MAGIHKYSSSLFIQSGAVAQFKNGISSSGLNVDGAVYAAGYFNLAGEQITSGDASVFFAGNPGVPNSEKGWTSQLKSLLIECGEVGRRSSDLQNRNEGCPNGIW